MRNYWYNKSSSAPLILQTSNLSEEMHCMGARFFLKMQMHLNQIMLFHCHDISHQSEGSIQTGNIHQMLSIFSKHSKSLVRHGTFTRPPAIIVARPWRVWFLGTSPWRWRILLGNHHLFCQWKNQNVATLKTKLANVWINQKNTYEYYINIQYILYTYDFRSPVLFSFRKHTFDLLIVQLLTTKTQRGKAPLAAAKICTAAGTRKSDDQVNIQI